MEILEKRRSSGGGIGTLDPVVLITGLTGGLGAELLPRLLDAYPAHVFVAPVRGDSDEGVAERLSEVLSFARVANEDRRRITALRADLTEARFGLPETLWRDLTHRTTTVFHLAANVGFAATLADARRTNVVGTERVLEFCRACLATGRSGFRLNHVSTAYVAGRRRGLLREDELDLGQAFWNAYEHSKNEAERLVAACRDAVPSTVYRPSQIIGDSASGRVRKYFGLYEILKVARRGRLPVLPGDARARQDMVPIDYVCDAMSYLGREPAAVGRTFHLAAGLRRSLPLAEAVRLVHGECFAGERGDGSVPLPGIEMPERIETDGAQGSTAPAKAAPLQSIMGSYLPYLAYEREFDVASTHALLDDAGIRLPAVDRTLLNTARYAIDRQFG